MNRKCRFYIALLVVMFTCWTVSAFETNQLQSILEETTIKGGLIVHIGCGSGDLTVALRQGNGCLVQGLDTEEDNVIKIRQYIRSHDLYGTVTADCFDGEHLPYTDNLVNLLVVSKPYDLKQAEIMRVLAPNGVAIVKQDDSWEQRVKPWPEEIDEWTHYLHGPNNNAVANDSVVGPPRYMQWLSDPLWTRNHHKLNSISALVTAQGKIFYIADESPAANIRLPGKWSLTARDAFNGVELWKRNMESWTWHGVRFRSGPPQVTRLLVVSDDRLFVPLGLNAPVSVLDAVSGQTLHTFDDTVGAEEMILADEILLVLQGEPVAEHAINHPAFKDKYQWPNRKSILAIDTETGKTLWEWSDPEANPMPETLASDGNNAYIQIGESVTCLDLKSGENKWTVREEQKNKKRSKLTYGLHTLVVVNDVVLCNLSRKLTALSAETGEMLWECQAGGGFHSPLDIFVINGLVWQGLHVSDSVAPPPVQDFSEGRDLYTGEVKRSNNIMVDLQTSGHHHRCYREKATVRFILAGKRGIEMMDLEDDEHSRNNWVRGTCQYGILPANGLIYTPPHSCGCYMESKLRGFWSLSAEKEERQRVLDERRLEKGPAYGQQIERTPNNKESWPQFRNDSLRSSIAKTALRKDLNHAWKTDIGGRLTQPVIASGIGLVAARDENTLYALDEKNGEVRWTYTVGGRIDSPPAIYHSRVLFGAADGRVYCLRLSDGELIWRFLAAPLDQRTVAFDQVESLWPVHGSVLILDGIAYCSAGRSTWLDGGIVLYGLKPESGEIVYKTHFESQHPDIEEGKKEAKPDHETRIDQNTTDYKTFLASDRSDAFSMAGGAVSDVLVSDGQDVFLHHVRFDKELTMKDRMKPHLFSTSSLLDNSENHRTHWVLGTGDFSRIPVAYSWIVNRPGTREPTIAVPSGLMMVFDNSSVWGVRRKGDAIGEYFLFEKKNEPFSERDQSLPDFRKISREKANEYVWKIDLSFHPRAMIKSKGNLFVGGMPLKLSAEDPFASYEGKKGGIVGVISSEDGNVLAEYDLSSPVIWDGMAAANGKLFVVTSDGSIFCFAASEQ